MEKSNEELATLIKQGDNGYLPQLWEQVRKIVVMIAAKYYNRLENKCGLELDDLIQEGYFGVLKAVEYYEPDSKYKFSSYLNFTLKNVFDKMTGKKYGGENDRILDSALSLDAPIENNKGTDELTLLDTISNSITSSYSFEKNERSVYNRDLRNVLDKALSELSEKRNKIVTLKYFFGMSQSQIATIFKCSKSYIGAETKEALVQMRAGPYRKELLSFMHYSDAEKFNPYKCTGFNAWKNGITVEEKFLIRMK